MGEINFLAMGETFTDLFEIYSYMRYENIDSCDIDFFMRGKSFTMSVTQDGLYRYLF